MMSEKFLQAAADLITAAGFHDEFSLHEIRGGANNRVFRVDLNGSWLLLKAYFQHPDDPRDRPGAEFAFSRFAWDNGVRCMPKPLACDIRNHLGLYEFVEGHQLLPHEVTKDFIYQALNFYSELNYHKQLPGALVLPKASEACFTIADHLQCVERRLQNLRNLDDYSKINREAAHFIRGELSKAWIGVADSVQRHARESGISLDKEITKQDKCLSPSDFGFHNAILSTDGHLRFIDFEYAGWDDPAKMACDFFCQPAVPVSLEYYDLFVEKVVKDLSEPEKHLKRFTHLFPVYQIKWCCIILNDFLPMGRERHYFTHNSDDQDEQKERQLQKARQTLQKLSVD